MGNLLSRAAVLTAMGVAGLAGMAQAHITLDGGKAVSGSTYKAVFRVPHGCAGSPTQALRIRIPEGMVDVKPMPKAGWQLTVVKSKLAQPYVAEGGAKITEGVTEVDWTGGSLPDDQYDEFVIHGKLPDKPGERVYFPTVQECAMGVNRWIEIPTEGKKPSDYKEPAPSLILTAKIPGDN